MNKVFNYVKKLVIRTRGMFPSQLPVGKTAYYAFADRLFYAYDLPKLPTYYQALAQMIGRSDQKRSTRTLQSLAHEVRKAQANEVAWNINEEFKQAQEREAKAIAKAAMGNADVKGLTLENSGSQEATAGMVQ